MAQFRHIFTSIILTAVAFITLPCFSGSASAVDYTASITTSRNKSINVAPRADGAGTTISADNITVQTTCRAGYNLTVATSVNDNNLYLGGDSSKNSAGTYFSPVDGSTALNSTTNAWGYYYNASNTPTESSVFSPIPASNSTVATVKTPVSSTLDINDTFNVYYGVSVANGMNTGTYKMIPDSNSKDGAIVYYLTMADACTSYTVHYNPTGADQNGTLRTGSGTVADQSIKPDIATNLTTATFTAPTGYYFQGWNTAQDGSGTFYAKGQSVTNLENATVGDTVTLYAQWTDCQGGKVCYSNNATSGVDGTMGNQSVGSTATSITLIASNFSRSGYGFAGWNTKADGTGTSYGPNETIDITAGQYSSGGLRLYAMWVASAGNLQGWTGCSSMNIGDVTALTDSRDNDTYAVAKLADGKCWMIENLRLGNTPELTATNTNNPSLPLTNLLDQSTNPATIVTSSNYLSATSKLDYNADTAPEGWCTTNSDACDDQSRLRTDNTTERASNPTSGGTSLYSYGNYYNWYSATAGNGTYSKSSGSVAGDLCPNGWHLPPDSNATAEFSDLDVAMGGTGAYQSGDAGTAMSRKWRSWPNNFVYSGSVSGSSVNARGSSGRYWSSTARSSSGACNMLFNSSVVYPGTNNYDKYTGRSVRCVAQ